MDLIHSHFTVGGGPHSWPRESKESLHSIKVSAGLLGIVLMTKVAASCLIKSNGRLIWKGSKGRSCR